MERGPQSAEPRGARLEVALLGDARRAARRGSVAVAGRGVVAGHLEQVGADRVEAVVVGHAIVVVERREQVEAGARAVDHRHRDRVVEGDHRVGRHALEQLVEREDLRPVGVLRGRRLVVDGGDRGLQLVGAERGARQRVGDERGALLDVGAVPEAAVLLGQRDQRAVGARCGPGAARR